MDNAIYRINHYPLDSAICFAMTCPLDGDLSGAIHRLNNMRPHSLTHRLRSLSCTVSCLNRIQNFFDVPFCEIYNQFLNKRLDSCGLDNESEELFFTLNEIDSVYAKSYYNDLTVARLRELHTVNMVYKCTHGLAPEHLQDRFVNRVSNYFLRDSSNKFVVPLPRTNYLKNSFRCSWAVFWKGLPSTLRQAESIVSFKSGCKEFFK